MSQTNNTPTPTTTPPPAQTEHMNPTTGEVVVGPVIDNASLTIGQLAVALAAAQLEIENASKDRTAKVEGDKASYSYGYATLASVYLACRIQLAKQGLAVIQRPSIGRENQVAVETIIVHGKSGEWISNRLVMVARGNTPQNLGSAITYARRYALSAMVGIAADDDDGEAAVQAQQPKRAAAQQQQKEPKAEKKIEAPPANPLTDDEVNALLLDIKGLETPAAGANLKKKLGGLKPRMPDHVQAQLGDVLRKKLAELNEAALKAAAEPPPKSTQAQGAAQP